MYFTCILHTSKRRGVADQAIFCGNSNITLGKFMDGFRLKMKNVARKKKTFFPFFYVPLCSYSMYSTKWCTVLFLQHSVHIQCTVANAVSVPLYCYSMYSTEYFMYSTTSQCAAQSTVSKLYQCYFDI